MVSSRFVALAAAVLIAAGSFGIAESRVALGEAATRAAATKPAPQAADKPAPKMKGSEPDPVFIRKHEAYIAQAKKGNIDLYFIGDSITDYWATRGRAVWLKEFSGWKPGNFGISGDQTQHVLWRLENGELDGVKPKLFEMMIGTNNLRQHSNEEIVKGNAAIIAELRKTNPQAKILLLGIFPRASRTTDVTNPRIGQINAELAKLADGKNVIFLDIGSKFLNEKGELPKDIMPDGLHPNEKGYQIWADAIKPELTKLLGEPAPAK
jgi:lysophospholipase L1-like esterase